MAARHRLLEYPIVLLSSLASLQLLLPTFQQNTTHSVSRAISSVREATDLVPLSLSLAVVLLVSLCAHEYANEAPIRLSIALVHSS